MSMRIIKMVVITAAATLQVACGITASNYDPSYDNVKQLAGANQPVGVEPFRGASNGVGKISMRGNSLKSPYGKDMVNYVEVALRSELERAKLLKADSPLRLSAVIEDQDVDVTGASIGKAYIKARFNVRRDEQVLYDKQISAEDVWDSSFVGAVAIPRGAAAYTTTVKKLLNRLYADPEFVAALTVQ